MGMKDEEALVLKIPSHRLCSGPFCLYPLPRLTLLQVTVAKDEVKTRELAQGVRGLVAVQ